MLGPGLWREVQGSSGICLQRVEVSRGVAKVGHKWGNLALFWCGWQTVGSAPDENRFTVCEQA
jgi:hypothetical protein